MICGRKSKAVNYILPFPMGFRRRRIKSVSRTNSLLKSEFVRPVRTSVAASLRMCTGFRTEKQSVKYLIPRNNFSVLRFETFFSGIDDRFNVVRISRKLCPFFHV